MSPRVELKVNLQMDACGCGLPVLDHKAVGRCGTCGQYMCTNRVCRCLCPEDPEWMAERIRRRRLQFAAMLDCTHAKRSGTAFGLVPALRDKQTEASVQVEYGDDGIHRGQ